MTVIRTQVTVQPGGLIEVRSPELQAGASAEVTVLVPDQVGPPPTWASFIGSGNGSFRSLDEIDAHIRGLRDEWEA